MANKFCHVTKNSSLFTNKILKYRKKIIPFLKLCQWHIKLNSTIQHPSIKFLYIVSHQENINSILKKANTNQLKEFMISDKLRLHLVWVQLESFYQCKSSMGKKRNEVCWNSTSQNIFQGGSWKITGPLPQNLWRRKVKIYPKKSVFFGDNRYIKGQNNDIPKELCVEIFCKVVIVLHNQGQSVHCWTFYHLNIQPHLYYGLINLKSIFCILS